MCSPLRAVLLAVCCLSLVACSTGQLFGSNGGGPDPDAGGPRTDLEPTPDGGLPWNPLQDAGPQPDAGDPGWDGGAPLSCDPCEGRQCGDDGHGGSCGSCGVGQRCDLDGRCTGACVPSCNPPAPEPCWGHTDCGPNRYCAVDQVSDSAMGFCVDYRQVIGRCDENRTLSDNERENGIFCRYLSRHCLWEGEAPAHVSRVTHRNGECRWFPEGPYWPTGGLVKLAPMRTLECGDDGCGGSCGTCTGDTKCSLGQCTHGAPEEAGTLWGMYDVNLARTDPNPIPMTCNYDGAGVKQFDDPGPQLPARLNAEMNRAASLYSQHVIDWLYADPARTICSHTDPVDNDQTIRPWGYLGEIGLQNNWCSPIAPDGSAHLTSVPHCRAMLTADANEWGFGYSLYNGSRTLGFQVQDIGTDNALLPVVIENEKPTTDTRDVSLVVWPSGIQIPPQGSNVRTAEFMNRVVDVQLSEDPCFAGANWIPWRPVFNFTLSPGNGRKVVYMRARDVNGDTSVSWDSIYLGPLPADIRAADEAISRIKSVRLPRLEKAGYDQFVYSIGAYVETENVGAWTVCAPGSGENGIPCHVVAQPWNIVDDPDAFGGQVRDNVAYSSHEIEGQTFAGETISLSSMQHSGNLAYPGIREIPVGKGELWFRVKTGQPESGRLGTLEYREDFGGSAPVVHSLMSEEFAQPGVYQYIRLPYERFSPWSIFYVEFHNRYHHTLIDRYEVWSEPMPLSATQTPRGLTLDLQHKNYRGKEIQIRYVNSQTGAWEEGPRINPFCSVCQPN